MNGNPRVPGITRRSDAPTVIGAPCAQIFAREEQESEYRPHHAEHLGNVG